MSGVAGGWWWAGAVGTGAVGVAVQVDDVGVVDESVDRGCGDDIVAESFTPPARPVRPRASEFSGNATALILVQAGLVFAPVPPVGRAQRKPAGTLRDAVRLLSGRVGEHIARGAWFAAKEGA